VSTYEDIEARRKISQGIYNNLTDIGQNKAQAARINLQLRKEQAQQAIVGVLNSPEYKTDRERWQAVLEIPGSLDTNIGQSAARNVMKPVGRDKTVQPYDQTPEQKAYARDMKIIINEAEDEGVVRQAKKRLEANPIYQTMRQEEKTEYIKKLEDTAGMISPEFQEKIRGMSKGPKAEDKDPVEIIRAYIPKLDEESKKQLEAILAEGDPKKIQLVIERLQKTYGVI